MNNYKEENNFVIINFLMTSWYVWIDKLYLLLYVVAVIN